MAIAAGTLRPTTTPRPLPGAMKSALSAPGPVAVAASGAVDGGSVALEPVANDASNRKSYWGYAIKAAIAGEQPQLGNGAIVEGFTGCTQGEPVYIGDDGALTHTAPTVELTDSNTDTVDAPVVEPIGIAVRTTAIYFFAR